MNCKEIAEHLPYWKEGITIPFWGHVYVREINQSECESVQELFARWKIAPKWKGIDELFYESLGAFFPQHNNKSITQLRLAFGGLGAYLDGMHKFIFGSSSIESKTKAEVCAKLREYADELPTEYHPLFPDGLGYHFENLYMALSRPNRQGWSERTYDNIIYSPIFHRYFLDNFPTHKSDQTIDDYLPKKLQNSVAPDLVLVSDKSPFFVGEWGEKEHASNHKDLPKIIETTRGMLLKRELQYIGGTNYVYGVLCGASKMVLFRMEHAEGKMYDCYFISELRTDLQTTILRFENIATILRINVILMIGGKLQESGKAKKGAEKSTSSVASATPVKIDTSAALKSMKTTKKKIMKKCSSLTELHKSRPSGDDDDDDDISRDFSKKLNFGDDTNTSTNNANATQDKSNNKKGKASNKGDEQKDAESESESSSSEEEEPNMIGRRICNGKYVVDKKFNKFVYLVKDEFGDEFVVKYNGTAKKFMKEEKLLAKLSNRFLKPIEAFDVTDGLRGLVFPFVERNRNRSLWANPKEFTERAFAIISAISELHEMNIAHSDIKFSNVLFGKDATYLIDFDLALNMNETFVRGFNGTFGYRAPEAIQYGRLSLKMDIYSYGILLFELACRERLYDMAELYDDNEEKMAQNIVEGIQQMREVSSWHSKLVDFINRCMTKELDKRPSAKEVMADPFFKDLRPATPTSAKTTTKKIQRRQSATQRPFQDITNTWQNN